MTTELMFVCAGCDGEFPIHRRATRSPYRKPLCSTCEPREREKQAKRRDQGKRW